MDIDTDHLCYFNGWVHLSAGDDLLGLYRLLDGPEWPADLGPEPEWFRAEHDEILDIYWDSVRFGVGCDLAAESAWATAKGR